MRRSTFRRRVSSTVEENTAVRRVNTHINQKLANKQKVLNVFV
jgi:regulator of replication initiation timing